MTAHTTRYCEERMRDEGGERMAEEWRKPFESKQTRSTKKPGDRQTRMLGEKKQTGF